MTFYLVLVLDIALFHGPRREKWVDRSALAPKARTVWSLVDRPNANLKTADAVSDRIPEAPRLVEHHAGHHVAQHVRSSGRRRTHVG